MRIIYTTCLSIIISSVLTAKAYAADVAGEQGQVDEAEGAH